MLPACAIIVGAATHLINGLANSWFPSSSKMLRNDCLWYLRRPLHQSDLPPRTWHTRSVGSFPRIYSTILANAWLRESYLVLTWPAIHPYPVSRRPRHSTILHLHSSKKMVCSIVPSGSLLWSQRDQNLSSSFTDIAGKNHDLVHVIEDRPEFWTGTWTPKVIEIEGLSPRKNVTVLKLAYL